MNWSIFMSVALIKKMWMCSLKMFSWFLLLSTLGLGPLLSIRINNESNWEGRI